MVLKPLDNKASFAQLYLLRKKLWDTNFAFKGMNGTNKLDDAIRMIDNMMTEQAVISSRAVFSKISRR